MKKKSNMNTWIAMTAVLCLGAILIVARHEPEKAPESASSEDRPAIRTTTRSNEISKSADPGLDDRRSPDMAVDRPADAAIANTRDAPVGRPATMHTGKPETRLTSAPEHHSAAPGNTHEAKEASRAETNKTKEANPGQSTSGATASPPIGVQLAPDVRLPVAALPVDFETNEVTERMLKIIVDDYYRDLTAGVTQDEEGNQTTRLEDNGETTIVVRNGPVAEAARQRADWRFRTIYGKEAYNRMSIHSNLEARQPVAPPANDGE